MAVSNSFNKYMHLGDVKYTILNIRMVPLYLPLDSVNCFKIFTQGLFSQRKSMFPATMETTSHFAVRRFTLPAK